MAQWTPEELQAASRAMKAMGYMSYDEFAAALEKLDREQNQSPVYRYYIQIPHITADRLPAGYTRFERWNSKPYCKDAGQEAFGMVEYPRPLSIQERAVFGLKRGKNSPDDLTT